MGHDDRERKFEKALERHLLQGAPRDASAAENSPLDNSSPACLDAATLAAFHERMLSNAEMDAAKAHIAACSSCQEILALLEATDEVVSDVVTDAEREEVFELAAPVLAGSPSQKEEYFPHAAVPATAARANIASKAPQSISTGRAKIWRYVAPAAALAAGLLIWVTAHDKLKRPVNTVTSLEVAQEKSADRQLADQLAPLPPASSPAETRESGRLDEALKSLNESNRSAGVLSPRRAPASAVGGVVGGEVGGVGNGVAGTPGERTRRELPLQGRNSLALKEQPPAKPAGNEGSPGDVSVTAAQTVETNAAELDRASAKDRKKADAPATPANAPADGTAKTGFAAGAGASSTVEDQNARDKRKISPEEKSESGVAGELSASSAPSPQPAAPPPAPARTAAKQSADATQKKESGANAITVTTEQAQVTANYESAASLQNDKAGLAKTSEARSMSNRNDSPLILTPGGIVLWRLRPGGKIERSADRGITWAPQNSGAKVELLAGSAPSDAVCWLVGRIGTILRTTDGGGHWSNVASPIAGDLGGIRAEDAQHATIFSATNNARFATSDGGATWAPATE